MLYANTYSGKLEATLIVIGWTWSNMIVAFKVIGTQLYLKNEGMDWADFFFMLISVRKAKSSKYMHRIKNGFEFLGPGVIKYALLQEQIDAFG